MRQPFRAMIITKHNIKVELVEKKSIDGGKTKLPSKSNNALHFQPGHH